MATNLPPISDSAGLRAALTSIDISVPRRTLRKTHHTETWSICRLLSTLGKAGLLHYPVTLTHRDKPDFVLTSGSREIGVEVTEAVPQQYAAYSALAERHFPGVLLELSHFRWGAPKLSLNQMRAMLKRNKLTGEPWGGDSPEREWALHIQDTILRKSRSLIRPDFSKFDENWLSIYDNLPLPSLDIDKAVGFLHSLINAHWDKSPSFSVIYIEHQREIVEISPSAATRLTLENLW